MLILVALGLAIGLAVGIVGGGGAVLAVPVLVYAAGVGVHEATTVSLAVVAVAATAGAAGQIREGAVCWSSAAWFASAAVAGSIVGSVANAAIDGRALLLIFSGVMLVAAAATWRRAGAPACAAAGCPQARAAVLVPVGLGVGALTGLVGVGGGFLVVPALAVGLSFGMREAMATSMVVIAIVSALGLLAHLAAGNELDVPLALEVGAASLAGALVAPALARRLPVAALGRAFSLLVAAVAIAVAGAAAAGVNVS